MYTRILTAVILTASFVAAASDLPTQTFATVVDKQGGIQLPKNFRQEWTHLGSWVVTDEKAPGHGFHDVYTQPEAARAFNQTGKFADGTVLVKEIRSIGAGALTTGQAQWATDPAVWFVMVKDSKARFDGPHWAEGWGWALYEAKDPTTNVSVSFEQTCQGCHLPAKDSDWVFLDGYPTLKR